MWANFFVKLFTSSGSSLQKLFTSSGCSLHKKKDEPDDVNNFTKHFAHILNFEFYCLYYI